MNVSRLAMTSVCWSSASVSLASAEWGRRVYRGVRFGSFKRVKVHTVFAALINPGWMFGSNYKMESVWTEQRISIFERTSYTSNAARKTFPLSNASTNAFSSITAPRAAFTMIIPSRILSKAIRQVMSNAAAASLHELTFFIEQVSRPVTEGTMQRKQVRAYKNLIERDVFRVATFFLYRGRKSGTVVVYDFHPEIVHVFSN